MIVLKYIVYFSAQLLGFIVLPWFCLAQAWEPCESTINPFGREPRTISRWKYASLNTLFGNFEDGVSGAEALIWGGGADAGKRVLYMPGRNPIWRAMCWSVGRNRANAVERYLGL